MSALTVFLVLLSFFAIGLIILPARLLAFGGSLSSLEALLLSLLSRILLGLGGGSSLPARVLLGFLGGLFVSFSSSEVLFSSDGPCSSGICIPSKVGFPSKSGSVVDVLEVMSSKILRSLTRITLF